VALSPLSPEPNNFLSSTSIAGWHAVSRCIHPPTGRTRRARPASALKPEGVTDTHTPPCADFLSLPLIPTSYPTAPLQSRSETATSPKVFLRSLSVDPALFDVWDTIDATTHLICRVVCLRQQPGAATSAARCHCPTSRRSRPSEDANLPATT